jgi:hypothetical protein
MVVIRFSSSVPSLRTLMILTAGGLLVLFSILKVVVITDPDTSLTRTLADAFLTNVYYIVAGELFVNACP